MARVLRQGDEQGAGGHEGRFREAESSLKKIEKSVDESEKIR
jgi:hypothetical protein